MSNERRVVTGDSWKLVALGVQGTCGACYMFAALDSLSDRHCIDTTNVGIPGKKQLGAPSNKCHATSNRCHATSNKKLLVTKGIATRGSWHRY